jgi:tetratricopeptide (TPR) repeat protein
MQTKLCLVFIFILLIAATTTFGQTSSNAVIDRADKYLEAKDYARAADLYRQILAANSASGEVWFKLAQCYQEQGEDQKALDALDQAEKNHFPAPVLLWRRSRLYAKLHQPDKAFETLNSLAAIGFSNLDRVKNENDFQSLRSDSRYAELLKKLDQNAHPCEGPEFHDFDFWVGEWDVTAAGQSAGTSSVQKILNNCVILENYSGQSGYAGKSFNSYDSEKKQWRQYWIDNAAGVVEFHGRYSGDQLVYEADSPNPDGKIAHRKMTFVKLPDGRVRQFSVQTTDGGKTWTPEYDLLYTKKK